MRKPKYYVSLSNSEYNLLIQVLNQFRNSLIQQGRYTDAVDELLCKFMK